MVFSRLAKSRAARYVCGFCLLFLLFVPQVIFAADYTPATGLDATAINAYVTKEKIPFGGALAYSIPGIIGQIIGICLAFLGVIFLILIIMGGFTWMTAGGNEQKATKAKDMLFSAVIGLVIVMSAYALTAFFGRALK
jgi:hypothetical protein